MGLKFRYYSISILIEPLLIKWVYFLAQQIKQMTRKTSTILRIGNVQSISDVAPSIRLIAPSWLGEHLSCFAQAPPHTTCAHTHINQLTQPVYGWLWLTSSHTPWWRPNQRRLYNSYGWCGVGIDRCNYNIHRPTNAH